MSLRFRLVLIVLALMTIGLLASDVATATLLRSYFLGRVDKQLDVASVFAANLLGDHAGQKLPPVHPPVGARTPPAGVADVQAARIDPHGHLVNTLQGPFSARTDAFSALPASVLTRARQGKTVRFAVTSGSGRYRGIAEPIVGSRDIAVVIAPLRDIEATLTRLYWIEGIATAMLLTLAGVLAAWLMRVGLRPIVHLADTADAVASGDVERRADISGGYEVARLGPRAERRVRRAGRIRTDTALVHLRCVPRAPNAPYVDSWLCRTSSRWGPYPARRSQPARSPASSTRRPVWGVWSIPSCLWRDSTKAVR